MASRGAVEEDKQKPGDKKAATLLFSSSSIIFYKVLAS